MSSARFEAPLTIDLEPSRLMAIGSALAHLLALVCLASCRLPLSASLVVGTLVAASFGCVSLWHLGASKARFIDQIHWRTDGKCLLRTADGRVRTASLRSSYTHPKVVILQFGVGRFSRRSVMILPDSADAQEIRRLRVELRIRRTLEPDELDAL